MGLQNGWKSSVGVSEANTFKGKSEKKLEFLGAGMGLGHAHFLEQQCTHHSLFFFTVSYL